MKSGIPSTDLLTYLVTRATRQPRTDPGSQHHRRILSKRDLLPFGPRDADACLQSELAGQPTHVLPMTCGRTATCMSGGFADSQASRRVTCSFYILEIRAEERDESKAEDDEGGHGGVVASSERRQGSRGQ